MPLKLFPPGRRGKYWTIRGTERGIRIQQSTETLDRREAEAFLRSFSSQLWTEDLAESPHPFWEALDTYIAQRQPRRLDRQWLERLRQYFGDRAVATILPKDVIAAAHELLPSASNAHKNRSVITLASAVLHYAAAQDWCRARPIERLKVSKKSPRKPIRDADMLRLIQATTGEQQLLLAVLYETGLRLHQAYSLKARPGSGKVEPIRLPKNDEIIEPVMSPELVEFIAQTPRHANNRIFRWNTRRSVYNWLTPLTRRLGIDYSPHLSRHAFATSLLEAGVPDRLAAEMGGWRDPRSLHRYQHIRALPVLNRSYKRGTE